MQQDLEQQQKWLEVRIASQKPGYTLKPCTENFGRSGSWNWTGIYYDSTYCGGFGFHEEIWFRVDVFALWGTELTPFLSPHRQKVREAVNQAIAELTQRQRAA